MTDLVDHLRAASLDVFEDEPVIAAYLYGSQADGSATPRSDTDVAVLLKEHIDIDTLKLRLRLGRKFEELVGGNVDLIVLDEAPLALRGRVQEWGRRFYCSDDERRVRYESLVSRMFHDFKVHEERSAIERIAAIARRS